VDIESKIWNYSNTGMKLHAFLNGVAICRSSIRRPGAEPTALDYCEAKSHQMCSACEAKFNAAIERAEASMEPSTGEGDYLPPAETPAKHGHHVVGPLRTDTDQKENDAMGYKQRRIDGPLTARQLNMLERLARGERQSEAAKNLKVSTSHVSAEVRVAATRMGASTSSEAVGIYTRAMAYLEAARLLEVEANRSVQSVGDRQVVLVLGELAKLLRDRAAALLPS